MLAHQPSTLVHRVAEQQHIVRCWFPGGIEATGRIKEIDEDGFFTLQEHEGSVFSFRQVQRIDVVA